MRLARLNCRGQSPASTESTHSRGTRFGAARRGIKRKTLRAKALGGSQKTSGKLCQLFSSFLRGASCPKSPRVKCGPDAVRVTLAATAAKLFMPEGLADVKREICREICGSSAARLGFQEN